MGGSFSFGQMAGQRRGAWLGATGLAAALICHGLCCRRGKAKIRLPAADQFQIDFRQQFRIQQRSVLFARRIVDAKPTAEGIERLEGEQ